MSSRASVPGNFLLGIRFALNGIAAFLDQPRLWLYALPPMAIVLAAYSGLLYWLSQTLLERLSERVTRLCGALPEWLAGSLASLAWWLAFGVLLLLLAILLGTLYECVGGPFFAAMVRHFECRRYGRPADPGLSLATDTRNTLACIVYALGTLVCAIPFYLAGLLFPVTVQLLAALILGRRYGIGYCSEAAFNRGLSLRDLHTRLFFGRQALLYGFGFAVFLIMLVPIVSVIAIPGLVIGGTMLVNEQTETHETPRPPETHETPRPPVPSPRP